MVAARTNNLQIPGSLHNENYFVLTTCIWDVPKWASLLGDSPCSGAGGLCCHHPVASWSPQHHPVRRGESVETEWNEREVRLGVEYTTSVHVLINMVPPAWKLGQAVPPGASITLLLP